MSESGEHRVEVIAAIADLKKTIVAEMATVRDSVRSFGLRLSALEGEVARLHNAPPGNGVDLSETKLDELHEAAGTIGEDK